MYSTCKKKIYQSSFSLFNSLIIKPTWSISFSQYSLPEEQVSANIHYLRNKFQPIISQHFCHGLTFVVPSMCHHICDIYQVKIIAISHNVPGKRPLLLQDDQMGKKWHGEMCWYFNLIFHLHKEMESDSNTSIILCDVCFSPSCSSQHW